MFPAAVTEPVILMMRVRVTVNGAPGLPGLMTFYWTSPTEDNSHAQEAVDHVRDFLVAGQSNMQNAISWATQGEVATINPATGVLTGILSTTSRSGAGTNVQDVLPGQVQGGMSLVTGLIVRGRRLRGHVNLPGPTEGVNGIGVPTATYQTTWASASTNLITDLDPSYVVWSRPKVDGGVTLAGATSPVLAITIQPKWFTLRSRRD